MTPMDLINKSLHEDAGFTVNIWLRSGVAFSNMAIIVQSEDYRHPRDTHLLCMRQDAAGTGEISIDFCEIAALEIVD